MWYVDILKQHLKIRLSKPNEPVLIYLAFDILALRNANNSCCFLNNLFGALFPNLGLEMQEDATLQILHTIFLNRPSGSGWAGF